MSIEEYIESGVLEAYVLGHLSEKEQLEVEKMAVVHPEVKKALRELGDNIRVDAHFKSVKPEEPILKETSEIQPSERYRFLNEVGIKPVFKKRLTVLQIAATVTIIASLLFNVILYMSWSNSNNQVSEFASMYQSISEKYEVQSRQLLEARETVKHFHNHGLVKVAMNEPVTSPGEAVGTVFYNPGSKSLFIHIEDIPVPPDGHKYEIWAIKDENVIDAGKVNYSRGFHKIGSLDADVKGFLITLEPEDNNSGISKGSLQWQGYLN